MATVTPQVFETYLAMIRNSVGAKTWQSGMALVDGKLTDVTEQGKRSCALFASSILAIFNRVEFMHINVDSTVQDMLSHGWLVVQEPEIGDVLIWEEELGDDNRMHKHIGFYMSEGMAVSVSEIQRVPVEHDWKYADSPKGERRIINILRYPDKENRQLVTPLG